MGKTAVSPAMIPDHKEIFVDPLRGITRIQKKGGRPYANIFAPPVEKYQI